MYLSYRLKRWTLLRWLDFVLFVRILAQLGILIFPFALALVALDDPYFYTNLVTFFTLIVCWLAIFRNLILETVEAIILTTSSVMVRQ